MVYDSNQKTFSTWVNFSEILKFILLEKNTGNEIVLDPKPKYYIEVGVQKRIVSQVKNNQIFADLNKITYGDYGSISGGYFGHTHGLANTENGIIYGEYYNKKAKEFRKVTLSTSYEPSSGGDNKYSGDLNTWEGPFLEFAADQKNIYFYNNKEYVSFNYF